MPGITGIISKRPRAENERDLQLMVGCMMHEPFYNSGAYVNDRLGLYVGWTVHKSSFADCMPVFNETKDLALIFAGEDFSDQELINNLKKQGHEFKPSNASSLIHLYEEEGEDFLKRLNGWFSGVLIDCRRHRAVLFNDRYGMHRIYYHENKDEFLFSSEAKSLLKVRPALRAIDAQGLGEFFSSGCVLENRSLFPGIFLLPGATAWAFQNGSCSGRGSYFEPTLWEDRPILEKETFYNRFKDVFLKILPRYFRREEPIGVSLTGGLDTRMIMAGVNLTCNSFPCYTFGGMNRESFDVSIARKIANLCHQQHKTLILGKDYLSGFSKCAEKAIYISDGYLDARGSYELYFNKLARKIAPVRVTGNYGSEALRGVRAFKAIVPNERAFSPDFMKHIRNAVKVFEHNAKGHRLTFSLFKQAPWHGHGRLSVERSQVVLRTPYMDNDLVKLLYQMPRQFIANKKLSLRFIADCNSAIAGILTDRGAGGAMGPFSMIVRGYRELLFRAEYLYDYGMPQWLTKIDHVLTPLNIEKIFLERHKFHHFRTWFRQELSEYLKDILFDKRTVSRPYLNNEFLEKMVSDHIMGVQNYTDEINKILTAELIHRLLIESKL